MKKPWRIEDGLGPARSFKTREAADQEAQRIEQLFGRKVHARHLPTGFVSGVTSERYAPEETR